jgi:LuxR family maltose regulon positive regulatory protein
LLARMADYYTSIHSPRMLIDIFVLQALVLDAKANEPQALEKLAAALALAEPGGFIRPFLDQGAEAANLLGLLLLQNPTQPYARQVLEAFGSEKTASSGNRSEDHGQSRSSSQGDPLIQPLSAREIEALKFLARGVSNKAIADALFISLETVKRHLSTIYRKLDVKNRHEAVVVAKSLGIL